MGFGGLVALALPPLRWARAAGRWHVAYHSGQPEGPLQRAPHTGILPARSRITLWGSVQPAAFAGVRDLSVVVRAARDAPSFTPWFLPRTFAEPTRIAATGFFVGRSAAITLRAQPARGAPETAPVVLRFGADGLPLFAGTYFCALGVSGQRPAWHRCVVRPSDADPAQHQLVDTRNSLAPLQRFALLTLVIEPASALPGDCAEVQS